MALNRSVTLAVFASLSVGWLVAQCDTTGIYNLADVKWTRGPASLPAGAEIAVLEGDPAKDGRFTMRLRLPDGYKIPPHWHPKVEHVTVVSGSSSSGWAIALKRRR